MDQFKDDLKVKQQSSQKDDLNLLNMIQSRIMEVIQIENECKRKLPKLYYQRLPRFMRRRASCHNTKRLPRNLRPPKTSDFGSKCRKSLMKYRRRTRFRKHKRILKKHLAHKFKDPNKCLMHKWFAKRFKMGGDGDLEHVPLYNNTKNQRNLYRQTQYGCAYLSLAHLVAIRINFPSSPENFEKLVENLNELTNKPSGFTFSAKAIEKGKYEVVVQLYKPSRNQTPQMSSPDIVMMVTSDDNDEEREYLCPALVSMVDQCVESQKTKVEGRYMTMWITRDKFQQVYDELKRISSSARVEDRFTVSKVHPREWTRIRLIGPNARDEAMKIAADKSRHSGSAQDCDLRLKSSFGLSIGRKVDDKSADFTYFIKRPNMYIVDIALKGAEGRMLWHQLVKNKSHLVGGLRDANLLLACNKSLQ